MLSTVCEVIAQHQFAQGSFVLQLIWSWGEGEERKLLNFVQIRKKKKDIGHL